MLAQCDKWTAEATNPVRGYQPAVPFVLASLPEPPGEVGMATECPLRVQENKTRFIDLTRQLRQELRGGPSPSGPPAEGATVGGADANAAAPMSADEPMAEGAPARSTGASMGDPDLDDPMASS